MASDLWSTKGPILALVVMAGDLMLLLNLSAVIDRYLVPSYPALALVAAYGFIGVGRRFFWRYPARWATSGGLGGIVLPATCPHGAHLSLLYELLQSLVGRQRRRPVNSPWVGARG
ncbi:MAG: hypothetical protein R2932_24515 [Caldilineaceae bacterium]